VSFVQLNVKLVLIQLLIVLFVLNIEFKKLQLVHVMKDKLKFLENAKFVTGIVKNVLTLKDIVLFVLKTELKLQPVFAQMVPMKSLNKESVQLVTHNVPNVKISQITV